MESKIRAANIETLERAGFAPPIAAVITDAQPGLVIPTEAAKELFAACTQMSAEPLTQAVH
ncbi:hypothetical protein QA640_22765 [Bradyrhizobium sp. CB82]|uniref:hypothetical protein n=1 Tax=Bradyrhizobium sp. CB82 TaxID=3039159 RepID=UPI0024B0F819|nr:hypothetical protein [Bradyrhizobium sp. CB82]WFU37317.1 hypothetical protein QA640_22765 [Bradyrhizobium sp. CB82]